MSGGQIWVSKEVVIVDGISEPPLVSSITVRS